MTESMPQQRPTGRRRWAKRLLFVFGLIVLLWWTGALAYWPRSQMSQALREHNLDEAEQWLRLSMRLRPQSAADYLQLAVIHRKQADSRAGLAIEKALELGLDKEAARIEQVLAASDSGRVEDVQYELDQLLINSSTDGQLVLESYVNGCLAAARLPQAETLIGAWAESFPDEAQPEYYRARLLMFYGRQEQAAKVLELN